MATNVDAVDISQNPTPNGGMDDYIKAMNAIKPNASAFDEFKATADEAVSSTITGSLSRMYMMSEARQNAENFGGQKASVEDLNRQYPGLPAPFKEPTDPFTAGEIARRQVEKKELEDTISNGPQGPLYAAGRFGAGLLAHAGDPLEIGAAMLTGAGAEIALGSKLLAPLGTKLGIGVLDAAGNKVAQTAIQRAATGVIEGSSAAATTEPANWVANKQDSTKNDWKSSAFNILLGGLTYGAIKAGSPIIASSLSRSEGNLVETLNQPQADQVHNYTTSLLSQDKNPDPAPLLNDFAREKAGQGPKVDEPSYIFKKQMDMEKIGEGKFYAPKESVEASFKDGARPKLGGDFGSGLYLTDNPDIANGVSAAKTLDTPGSIHEVTLGDSNLIKMDEVPTGKALESQREFLNAFAKEHGVEPLKADLTPRDVIESLKTGIDTGEIKPDVLENYYDGLQKSGADGLHYEVSQTGGVSHEPYNAAYIFDHESDKISQSGVADANPDRVREPSPQEINSLGKNSLSHESDIWHDPKAQEEFDKHLNQGIPKVDQTTFENQYKEARQEMEHQLKQEPDSATQAKLDKIDEVAKRGAQMEKLAKSTLACFGRSG